MLCPILTMMSAVGFVNIHCQSEDILLYSKLAELSMMKGVGYYQMRFSHLLI
jgi:hypothetical protein